MQQEVIINILKTQPNAENTGLHGATSQPSLPTTLPDNPVSLRRSKRGVSCSAAGESIAHETDCRKYHICDDSLEPGEAQRCFLGKHFQSSSGSCVPSGDAGCTLPGPSTCDYDVGKHPHISHKMLKVLRGLYFYLQ